MSSSTQTLPPVRPPRTTLEERYRAVLQVIAAGNPMTSRPLPSAEAQGLARRALIEMGDDWTKHGLVAAENRQQSGG